MPPKKTPYQFKKGLTYVKQVPRFLQGLTSQASNYNDDDKRENENINSEESSDDELNAAREEERPQIVVLKEGKHMSEREVKVYLESKTKSKEKDPSSVEDKESDIDDDDTPVVDEKTGKILFRKPKTKKAFTSKSTTTETVLGFHSKTKNEPIKAINEAIDSMKRKRDNDDDRSGKKAKPAKKTSHKMKSHLSFNDDEM